MHCMLLLASELLLRACFRFVMLRGSSGFYCYAILEHASGYPALSVAEARIAFKLNAAMSVSGFYCYVRISNRPVSTAS